MTGTIERYRDIPHGQVWPDGFGAARQKISELL
jgi:hypothetical protein